MKVAVAMSVYKTDRLCFLQEAIQSVLSQTYTNFELYIEVDGPVNDDVRAYLSLLHDEPKVFVNFNEKNLGLAFRLNQIVDKVLKTQDCGFIARMDADDISSPTRFHRQVEFLYSNTDISIVGSDVIEFSEDGSVDFYKKMPRDHKDLVNSIVKRCPFNHPSVMFRIDVFEKYNLKYKDELKNTQDYYLWVDAIKSGVKLANINEPLLKFRIDEKFHSRRGIKKAKNDFNARIYAIRVLKLGTINNYLFSVLLFALRLSPVMVKKLVYSKFR
ncbi:TPA: glycosyltransferase [Vibrio parahaemolyticus]|nr:glycosyltransferase [Vibrio parahaemolyticus]HAS6915504.1 glycosyltransferase [Vibrio parahaemolyticus]HAS6925979.1 glycosyltransferase [Vibrio parahaemolyticus]